MGGPARQRVHRAVRLTRLPRDIENEVPVAVGNLGVGAVPGSIGPHELDAGWWR